MREVLLAILLGMVGCTSEETRPLEDFEAFANRACEVGIGERARLIRYARATGAGGEGTVSQSVADEFIEIARQPLEQLRDDLSGAERTGEDEITRQNMVESIDRMLRLLQAGSAAAERNVEVDTRPLNQLYESPPLLPAEGPEVCKVFFGSAQGILDYVGEN